ncbi:MAG: phosphomannomutase [Thiotrichales bacterium]
MKIDCFKAYDVRGRVPEQLNAEIAWRIGRAFAEYFKPLRVAVGYDIRETSPELARNIAQGLVDGGSDVLDIGMCGTEEIYHATAHFSLDGGIMVTASHNPIEYNGLKLVRRDAQPVSGDSGLFDIRDLAQAGEFAPAARPGSITPLQARPAYLEHLLTYVDKTQLKPLKIVVNPGNGGAGLALRPLAQSLPFEFVEVHFEPDRRFPNGIPNPLLPERRTATIEAIQAHGADLGISWDGDFDRCFLFDENGRFIEGYYIVGLLAQAFLEKHAGEKIVHDPRLTWNTIDIVRAAGGIPVQSKTGHAFIKERMRLEDAIYGGEMSAHHYFRDFAYCDSGMIPWLLVTELMSRTGKRLSQLVDERMRRYPCSGEINFTVNDAKACTQAIEARFRDEALRIDYTDGLSMEFAEWRFNVRASNTEPLLRLNVESRGDAALMQTKTQALGRMIEDLAGA